MLQRPTIIVLGAGASAPYGLPVGTALRRLMLSRDERIERFVFGDCMHPEEAADGFRTAYKGARVASIDAFLEHADERTRQIGKRMLAATIALNEDPTQMFPAEGDWLEVWFDILARSANAEQFLANPVTTVTFNYDRSYEYAIYLFLVNRYRMSPGEAIQRVNALPIIHLHGSLGPLAESHFGEGREYRPDLRWVSPDRDMFRLIYEENGDNSQLQRARNALAAAERVVVLGFAFHEMNSKRLFHSVARNLKSQWRACRLEMTDAMCSVAKRWIPTNARGMSPDRHSIEFGERRWDGREFLRENMDFLID
jgi:hypothetical protein